MRIFICFVLFLNCVVSRSFADTLTLEEMQSDFNQLVSSLKANYGPLEYKKRYNIDIDILAEKYHQQINKLSSNHDFYYFLAKFIAEFRDSHFSINIPTTHATKLGFEVDLVEDKVLIDTIDRSILNEFQFPFNRGDELIAINGRPVNDIIAELSQYIGSGYTGTRKRTATFALTQRRAARFPVETGTTTVSIKLAMDGTTKTVALNWIESGEAVDENETKSVAKSVVKPHNFLKSPELSLIDNWDSMLPHSEFSYRCSGSTRIKIPQDAVMIQKKPFVAYYHDTPKGKVGYLRIPHYSPDRDGGTAEEFFARYEYAVAQFEKHTVGLVIDQDHNCGGSVSYLHDLLGLFMKEEYAPMQFELLASKSEYLEFRDWLKEVPEQTLVYQSLKSVVELIKSTWLTGNQRLTEKTSIDGHNLLSPNPIRYTKPIVMLIDELSGSGGDAFPALMQGYGRAKLIGSRTMGAGGHVIESPAPLFYSAVGFRITKSLFYRPDGLAVENNGVSPDQEYQPTIRDFNNGYLDYQRTYLELLLAQ